MNLPVYGKGVYIWLVQQIEKGDPKKIADKLQAAGVSFVAIKIHNGVLPYTQGVLNVGPVIDELRKRGIVVGAWGYVYLATPVPEANVAISTCKLFKPAFYLIDAESHAKGKFAQAKIFAQALRFGLPEMPIGMNSYWKPTYHPELPWNELREVCDFDTPQVYWRGGSPVAKTAISQREYSLFKKKLPFPMPAGEMYHEFGITTTVAELNAFLTYCKVNYQAAVMWSADANETNAELWKAFSEFQWDVAGTKLAGSLIAFFDNAKGYAASHLPQYLELYKQLQGAPIIRDPMSTAAEAAVSQILLEENQNVRHSEPGGAAPTH
jgi:hypothetical protein